VHCVGQCTSKVQDAWSTKYKKSVITSATSTNDVRQRACRTVSSSQMTNIFCPQQTMYEPLTARSWRTLDTNARSNNSVMCYVNKYENEEQATEGNHSFVRTSSTHIITYICHHYRVIYNFICNQHVITM
jgi:hypothetical protein